MVISAGATIALVSAACAGSPSEPGARPSSAGPPTSTLPSSPTELPDFTPASFQALLESLRGFPVVVNFWASWCGPCTLEAPGLAAMAKKYSLEVQFVGVDIIDHRAPAREFIQRFGWNYPSVFDATGSIRDALGLVGQPHTVFYDATGKQVLVWSGAVSEDLLDEQLAKLTSA